MRTFSLAITIVAAMAAGTGCASTGTAAAPVTTPVTTPAVSAVPAETAAPAAGLSAVEDRRFDSAALGRRMSYRVILPTGYNDSLRRFPTLYLLHGLTGSFRDWESRTDIYRASRDYGVIIVMPDGEDSWYTNSQGAPAAKFETYIADDLVAEVDRTYRTIGTRHGRAIAGLSMGGFGALKYGIKYPGRFVFAGSFSGALGAASASFSAGNNQKLAQELLTIFGPAGSPARAENDLLPLIEKADPAALPYLYVDCGADDRLLEQNRAFVAALQKKKVRYEYHEVPGAHTWDYWDRQFGEMLRALARTMR